MGFWARTGRLTKVALLIAAGAAGGGAAIAVASVPDSNGVIHGCYSVNASGNPVTTGPNLTVIDPNAGQSCATTTSPTGAPPSQRELSWNQLGPPGPSGPQGPSGPAGAPGAPGQTATVVQGQKLTLPGGEVIAVGGTGGAPAPVDGGGVVGEVSMGDGSVFKLRGFSFGTSQSGTSGSSSSGAGAGKVKFKEFSIKKLTDKSSPIFFLACATGKHFPKVTVTLKKNKVPYLVIKMTDVLISSYSASSKAGSTPEDTLTLNFAKIDLQYTTPGKGNAPPVKVVKVLQQ